MTDRLLMRRDPVDGLLGDLIIVRVRLVPDCHKEKPFLNHPQGHETGQESRSRSANMMAFVLVHDRSMGDALGSS